MAGFVNGLFLVFVAFFILSEAVEVSRICECINSAQCDKLP